MSLCYIIINYHQWSAYLSAAAKTLLLNLCWMQLKLCWNQLGSPLIMLWREEGTERFNKNFHRLLRVKLYATDSMTWIVNGNVLNIFRLKNFSKMHHFWEKCIQKTYLVFQKTSGSRVSALNFSHDLLPI